MYSPGLAGLAEVDCSARFRPGNALGCRTWLPHGCCVDIRALINAIGSFQPASKPACHSRTQGTRGTRLHEAVSLGLSCLCIKAGVGLEAPPVAGTASVFCLSLLSNTGRGQQTRQSDRTTRSEPFMTKVCPGHQWSVLCGPDSNSRQGRPASMSALVPGHCTVPGGELWTRQPELQLLHIPVNDLVDIGSHHKCCLPHLSSVNCQKQHAVPMSTYKYGDSSSDSSSVPLGSRQGRAYTKVP